MKHYSNKLLLLALILFLFLAACKKEESVIKYEGGNTPVLAANLSNSIPLIPADSLKNAIVLSWTNPNYMFTNGINSQNVNYNLEIDTLGANFTNPSKQTLSFTSSLDTTLTVKSLNSLVTNKLGLTIGQTHNIQFRVIASLSNQLLQVSNTLNFVVLPYTPPLPPPVMTPPTTGTLFIIGSALASGWTQPVPAATQQFTQISSTEYKISVLLTGALEYKFIAKNGSWGENWGIATADDPAEINGGKFTSNSSNIMAPATTGTYDIVVNFQTGKFTVTPH